MADCFAKWKIVLAIKSDTNNVLVTVVRMFVCSCWSWTGWRKKIKHTQTAEREKNGNASNSKREEVRPVYSLCWALFSSINSFHFGSYHHIKRLPCAYKYVLYCIIELVCFRFSLLFFRSPLYLHIAAIVLLQWNKLHVMESIIFEMLNRMDIKRRIETVRAYKIGLIYLLSQPNRF